MASKAFKRKMKNLKSGNCYWRIHGVPVPLNRDTGAYVKQYHPVSVIIDNYIFYAEQEFAEGKKKYQVTINGVTKPSHLKNGTCASYYKSSKGASKFLKELEDGLHPAVVYEIIDFHASLDAIDACFGMGPDHDDFPEWNE